MSDPSPEVANAEYVLTVVCPDRPGIVHAVAEFGSAATAYAMDWQLFRADTPYRALVMVSRSGHCLNDLLFRQSRGALNIVVPAVVGNHRDLERMRLPTTCRSITSPSRATPRRIPRPGCSH